MGGSESWVKAGNGEVSIRTGELGRIRRWKIKLKRSDRQKKKVVLNKFWSEFALTPHHAKRWLHSSHSLCKLLCYYSMPEIISHFFILVSLTQARKNRLNILRRQKRLHLTSQWTKTRDFIIIVEPSCLFSAAVVPLQASQFRVNISLSNPAQEYSRPYFMQPRLWCKWRYNLHWKWDFTPEPDTRIIYYSSSVCLHFTTRG